MPYQTATNPSTGERVILLDGAWKPLAQSATDAQGTKAYLVDGAWLVDKPFTPDDIPGMPKGPIGKPAAEEGLGSKIRGVGEAAVNLAAGFVGAPIAALYGVGKSIASGKYGTPEGVNVGIEASNKLLESGGVPLTTETGKTIVRNVGKATETGLGALPVTSTFAYNNALVGPSALARNNLISMAAEDTRQGVYANKVAKANQMVAADEANAPKLAAFKDAQDMGVVISPAQTNPPSKVGKVTAVMAGPSSLRQVQKANADLPNQVVKRDLGLASDAVLDRTTFDALKETAAEPYAPVKAMPRMAPSEPVLGQLEALKQHPKSVEASGVNPLVDAIQARITEGISGAEVLKEIQQNRAAAKTLFNNPSKKPIDLTEAEVRLGIANALENLLDANAPPEIVPAMREARAKLANIYSLESVVDPKTKRVDPIALGKLTAENPAFGGEAARLGNVINHYPEAFDAPKLSWGQRITRAGATGSLAASLGWHYGGGTGAVAAGIGGGLLGFLGEHAAGKFITTPTFQQNFVAPRDLRGMYNANNLAAQANAYNYIPNYTQGAPETPAPGQPQRMALPDLRQQTGEQAMAFAQGQNAIAYRLAQARDEAAAAQMSAQEAATRQPARGGTVYDLDPTTGRLQPADRGIPGATPDTIQSTGNTLVSAVQKLASDQAFALSAEERIAWNKTRVDLELVDPGFRTLTDKEVLGKAMDRQWAEAAVQKARDKALAFDEIARRSKDRQAVAEAQINREKMLDLAEMLQEALGPRPAGKFGPGPKTRAARRNALAPENQNALR